MRQRKEIVRLSGLLLPAALLLGGCGGQKTAANMDTAVQEQAGVDENLTVVGVSQIGAESDWRNANTESIKSVLTEENGYYLIFEDAQQKQENQIKAVRNFILQDVDYIVLVPIVETGWEAVLQEAKDAGIPVILADRMADVNPSLYTCWIGADFEKEGEEAGKWLAAYLEENGRQDEEINIVTIQGTEGASAQIGRTTGFSRVMNEHPNWKMLDMVNGDFTQAKGREAMEGLLEKYEDIDVLISENDNMTFGAVDAILQAGRTCGPKGEITVISFDAVRAVFDHMEAGEINAVFECNPLHGPKLLDILKSLEAGKEVDKIQYMDETYFDTSMDLEQLKKERLY